MKDLKIRGLRIWRSFAALRGSAAMPAQDDGNQGDANFSYRAVQPYMS
jgi:hypothetical protein